MQKLSAVTGFILCGYLSAAPAAADVVTDWNTIATQAVAAAGALRPGPSALIDLAMVHVAIHDAMQAYQGQFELYAGPISNPSGSPDAAVAKAARDVLIGVGLTSTATSTVAALYDAYLVSHSLVDNAGAEVGQQAAAHILNLRVNNTGAGPPNPEVFLGGTGPGEWRPTSFTPTGTPVPMVAAYLGTLVPFTLKEPGQFGGNPPPHLASGKYVDEYNEVKSLGALNGSDRTAEQTDTALFFADNAIQYWNRTLRTLVDSAHVDDSGDRARLFALVNLAMADAMITSWEAKRHWNFWRPITAIQLGDTDGNSRTEADPTWLPYIATPNYPDHTSGANGLNGAATTMLGNFFGTDKVSFTMTSNFVHPSGATPQNPRHYERFSDAAQDIEDARIWQGIHFRSADAVGRRAGKAIANWVFSHALRPVN
jgi:hypothetical protein